VERTVSPDAYTGENYCLAVGGITEVAGSFLLINFRRNVLLNY
jgi:hypothetical protein